MGEEEEEEEEEVVSPQSGRGAMVVSPIGEEDDVEDEDDERENDEEQRRKEQRREEQTRLSMISGTWGSERTFVNEKAIRRRSTMVVPGMDGGVGRVGGGTIGGEGKGGRVGGIVGERGGKGKKTDTVGGRGKAAAGGRTERSNDLSEQAEVIEKDAR